MDRVLMNYSPSNIIQPLLLLKRYHQKSQSVLAAAGHEWVKYGLLNRYVSHTFPCLSLCL